MNVDAARNGAGLTADRSLSRSPAVLRVVLKACSQGRRRLSVAILLAAALAPATLTAKAVALSLWQEAPQEVTLELNESGAFSSFPPFIAELKHGKARVHVLQLALAVEVPASQQWRLEGQQSAIEEVIKTRLRHFDRRDLEGNAGADRLRDEVLGIVNDAIAPAAASRVLFWQLVLD